MRKIGIIGSDSAALQCTSHMLSFLSKDWEVHSIHGKTDEIDEQIVSTIPSFATAIEYGADLNLYNLLYDDRINCTINFGIYYENWRKHAFINPFPVSAAGVHIEMSKMASICFPRFHTKWKDKYKEIIGDIDSIENLEDRVDVVVNGQKYQYDYIIDCRSPETYNNHLVIKSLVNHCLFYNAENGEDVGHTKHVATKDGWMNVISLRDKCSYQYYFNNDITDVTVAEQNFCDLINADKTKIKSQPMKFYYATNLVEGRIIKNGKNCFFMEPLFSNCSLIYDKINRFTFDYINGNIKINDVNRIFVREAQDVEHLIYFHYHGGSVYDSEFWKTTSLESTERLKGSERIREFIGVMEWYKENKLYGVYHWCYPLHNLMLLDKNFDYGYGNKDGTMD